MVTGVGASEDFTLAFREHILNVRAITMIVAPEYVVRRFCVESSVVARVLCEQC